MTSNGTYARIAVMCEDCGEVQVGRKGPDGAAVLYWGATCPCGGTEFADLTAGAGSRLPR